MANKAYDDILQRAQAELSPEEQSKLVDQLSQHVARKNSTHHHDITELKGLGKDIWKGVKADDHVAKERDSWDG